MFLIGTITPVSFIIGLLQVLGAVGIFLYGMKVMSEAIQRVAGKKLRSSLSGLTRNRFTGVLTGLFTTALVQSSTATTVLAVSFVNAGLLTLIQSVGIIMGANLGTTVTAWIIALVGKFDLGVVALPVIGVSLPLVFIGKDKLKSWGEVFVGFGLLFFGLGLLKSSVPDLQTLVQTDPDVAATIHNTISWVGSHGFTSIILYVIVGIVLTLIAQSSSAAIAITITCAVNGWFGDLSNPIEVFRPCCAIVLGENLGTTCTAWLASIGANVNAKRAARAHFTFNFFGVLWVLIFFLPFTSFVWKLTNLMPQGMRSAAGEFQIAELAFGTALFHTVFNLCSLSILVWFVPQMTRFVEWWVRDSSPEAETPRLQFISQGIVRLGELNFIEAENATRRLNKLIAEMFKGFTQFIAATPNDLEAEMEQFLRMEDQCDEMAKDISSYLIRCTSLELSAANSNMISSILRVVTEHERASHRIYRLLRALQRKDKKGYQFREKQEQQLLQLVEDTQKLLKLAGEALSGVQPAQMEQAQELMRNIKRLRKKADKTAVKKIQKGGKVKTEMLFLDLSNNLKSLSDHSMRIITISKETKLVFGHGYK